MKAIKILLLGLIITQIGQASTRFSVYEANYPGVRDDNVNIEESTLVIYPRGNYFEINITMSVSYDFNSWFFKNYNELEYMWEFSLPEEAIMDEFWIWFGDSIMEAGIMDKWTAEALFNDVSTPVRNPGLLTQSSPKSNGMVDYELRLFPIMRNETKRYKIQYLVPARPFEGALRLWLPSTQLVSENTFPIDQLRVLYKYDTNNEEPQIIGADVLSSTHHADKKTWEMFIPLEQDQFIEMTVPTQLEESDYYFSAFHQNNEQFYHFAVNPPAVPLEKTSRNILFVIDFNRINTNGLDGEYLMTFLKETIQRSLNEEDSINVIIAYDQIVQGDENWVACSEVNVDSLFLKIIQRQFPSYSYFQPLLIKASDWMNKQSGKGEILLISNTDATSLNLNSRQNLAEDILGLFEPDIKIHVMDLENKSYLRYNWQYYGDYSTGYYETQLQSLYGKLTYQTGGNLYYLRFYTIKTILNAFFFEAISHFESVEVQMTFQNGYSHSKHLMEVHEGYYPLHFPIMEVGKYTGDLPVQIKILGKLRNNTVKKEIILTENDLDPGHPQIATSWYGEHIHQLVNKPYDPLTINEIIDMSVEKKILTPYSGLIVFNPDSIHGFCTHCVDGTDLESGIEFTSLFTDSLVSMNAYPNPFNAQTCIQFNLPDQIKNQTLTLNIYNVLGQSVLSLQIDKNQLQTNSFKYYWEPNNNQELPTGIYIVRLSGKSFQKTKRLMYLK